MTIQKHVLTTWLLDLMNADKTFNGYTDSRQEIIWSVNGVEVARSNGGVITEKPVFIDLAVAKLRDVYGTKHAG